MNFSGDAVIGKNNKTVNRKSFVIIPQILLFLLVVLMTIPLIWIIFLSLKTNVEIFNEPFALPAIPRWDNYVEAIKVMGLSVLIRNTLLIASISITGGMFMTIISSFAISRMRFGKDRLQNIFYIFFISGVIVPVFVILFPVYIITVKLGLVDTLWAMILPYLGWAAPMNTLIMVGSFRSISTSLEEAAIIDGCGLMKIIFRIEVPILIPTIATTFIISFLGIWNDFPLSVVMLTSPNVRTVALAASYFKGLYSLNYSLMTAGIIILLVPQLIVFSFFQKYIVEGISSGSVKG